MNFNNYSKVVVWELLSILPPRVVLAINNAPFGHTIHHNIWKFLLLRKQKQKCGVVQKEKYILQKYVKIRKYF